MKHLYIKKWGNEDREPDRPKLGLDWFGGAKGGFFVHVDFFDVRLDFNFIPAKKMKWYEAEFGAWAGKRIW